jgi:hypothetical protein
MSDVTSPDLSQIRKTLPEEVLKPGALYSECAAVQLQVTLPQSIIKEHEHTAKEERADASEENRMADDGELGGELAGRLVWESFEKELKSWVVAGAPSAPQDNQTTTSS